MTDDMVMVLKAITAGTDLQPGAVLSFQRLTDRRPWYRRWFSKAPRTEWEYLVVDPDNPRTWLEP